MPTVTETPNKFILEPFQTKAFLSPARYVGMVSGWATGKSLVGIGRAMKHCEEQSDALYLIARKEFTDLQDSTIKDFITYTGLTPNGHREVKLSNGSCIMFRHLEELGKNNLQNINLSGAWIEQGEELESDEVFYNIFGRLRRKGFKHELVVTANADGHNWVWETYIGSPIDKSECIQAVTYDNRKNLTQDFIDSLDILHKKRPEIYERLVMNNHEVGQDKMVVLTYQQVQEAVDQKIWAFADVRKLTVVDPSDEGTGDEESDGDENVIYNLTNTVISSQEIYMHHSLMDTCGRVVAHVKSHGSSLVVVDGIGVGAGLYSRLVEIFANDAKVKVHKFDSRISPPEEFAGTYHNYKTYAWFQARDKYFGEHTVSLPNDPILVKQLATCPYKYTSNGKYIIRPKKEIRRMLNDTSPDRGDCYVMGLDGLQFCTPVVGVVERKRSWMHPAYRTGQSILTNPYADKGVRVG